MATKHLILLRHAKSDWQSGALSDFERPLNRRGKIDAPQVGRWLHFNGYSPDVIDCSSAVRARETLQGVMTELDVAGAEVLFSGHLYHANEVEIAEVAEEHLSHFSMAMIVGHNPGLEMALMHYCSHVDIPEDGKLMVTACLAVIEFENEVGEGLGRLRFHKRPDKI